MIAKVLPVLIAKNEHGRCSVTTVPHLRIQPTEDGKQTLRADCAPLFYKVLEHPRILVSARVLESIPRGNRGTTVLPN